MRWPLVGWRSAFWYPSLIDLFGSLGCGHVVHIVICQWEKLLLVYFVLACHYLVDFNHVTSGSSCLQSSRKTERFNDLNNDWNVVWQVEWIPDESEFYFRAVVISLAVLSFGRFLMIVFFLGTYIVLYSKKVKEKIVNLFRASWRSFCEALSYCNLFEYQVHTFAISNRTKQGGVLSLYLFTPYIWYLLCDISGTPIGGLAVNIIAYAFLSSHLMVSR